MGRLSDLIAEQIKKIDVDSVKNWSTTEDITSKVVEEQKVFFWIRLYLKSENSNISIGDDVTIKYKPSGEALKTQFIYFSKKGLVKDHDDEIVNYSGEDDKKCLCLMIEEKKINYGEDIPFIRTLFKNSIHYEYQLVKRDDLLFINDRTGEVLDYIECDF